MQYNISYREKDKGIQVIISYKDQYGKWKQKSRQGFKTKKEAKMHADKMLEELKQDITLNTSSEFEGITFGEFGKMYLEHMKLYREFNTIEGMETALNRYSNLNNIELKKITVLDMQKIIDMHTKEGLHPNSIRNYLTRITTLLNSAKNDYKLINEIPTKNVQVNKAVDTNKRALNDEEIRIILTDFKDDKCYPIIFLALNTGMRVGEILGLTWSDIDFENRTISVNKQWKKLESGIHGFGKLKSKNSKRMIPVSESTIVELKKYRKVINMDNRVFAFKSKESIITALCKSLKPYNITLHELRHTYATKLVASNMLDFKTIASILGHDVKQTMETYSHVTDDMMNRAKNVIENIF